MLRSQDAHIGPAASSSHANDIRAISLIHDGPVTRVALDAFLMLLSSTVGANLLRMKGLVRIVDDPDRPMVVHAVQHLMHRPTCLSAWPDEDRRTRLVVIGRGHDERALVKVFHAVMDADNRSARARNWGIPALAAACVLAVAIGAALLHLVGTDAAAAIRQLVIPANGDRP